MSSHWRVRYSINFAAMGTFDLKEKQKQMIANQVKESRLAKGYTQQELSDLSNISVRSIQRIENGEIIPRSYTLKTLGGILGISFEGIQKEVPVQAPAKTINTTQRIILSAGVVLFIVL